MNRPAATAVAREARRPTEPSVSRDRRRRSARPTRTASRAARDASRMARSARPAPAPRASRGRPAAATARAVAPQIGRQVARATRPMLRVVSGGLDRLPAGDVAGPVARGRVLILIAAVLAAGLVYVNVGALEAGDSLGRSSVQATELQRENTQLRAKIAQLGSTDRIQKRAAKLGLTMPVPEQFKFVRADDGDPLRATRNYTAPQPTPAPASGPSVATGPAAGQTPAANTGPSAGVGAPDGAGAPTTGANPVAGGN